MYRQRMGDTKESIDVDYDIVKQIGSGSFGQVYLVKNNEFKLGDQCSKNEFLVMKQISLTKLDARQRSDAQKEILLLSTLSHPNIVSYRHSFENDAQQLNIIMDYCDGGDLYRKVIERRRMGLPFEERQLVQWFVQICLALRYIHERKILHRDLKTQNIFACDGDNIVKVGDFGIARILDHTADLAATCIGTPYYLSPEVCQNRPYGTKTDVWALGCVLYELATLRHPFEGRHLTELLTKIVRGSYEPLPPNYSAKLRQLVGHMLRVSSSERPDVSGLLQKEYVFEHASDFLKHWDRLSELAVLEDLVRQKRRASLELGKPPVKPVIGGGPSGSSIRRHTVASSSRSKSMSNASRRAYFEKKFRMYLPASGMKSNGKSRAAKLDGEDILAAILESQVPSDPIPPNVDALGPPESSKEPARIDKPQPEPLDLKATHKVEPSVLKPPDMSIFGQTIIKPRRERKKWAALKPPTSPQAPVTTSSSQKLDSTLTITKPAIKLQISATPDQKRKSGGTKPAGGAGSMPSIPGAVDDGWSQDDTRTCEVCGGRYVIGKLAKKQGKDAKKHCQSCQLAKKKQANMLMANDNKSVFEKIECLRSDLEKSLGIGPFTHIYQRAMSSSSSTSGRFDAAAASVVNGGHISDQDKTKLETLLFFEKAYLN